MAPKTKDSTLPADPLPTTPQAPSALAAALAKLTEPPATEGSLAEQTERAKAEYERAKIDCNESFTKHQSAVELIRHMEADLKAKQAYRDLTLHTYQTLAARKA